MYGSGILSPLINVHVTGTLTDPAAGNYEVGGLIGNFDQATMSGCSFVGTINSVGSAGGLAGYAQYFSSISNSYFNGTINGVDTAAGLAWATGGAVTISGCYSAGTINAVAGSTNVGGLVAFTTYAPTGSITASYSTMTLNVGTGSTDIGGLAGNDITYLSVSDSYFAGVINAAGDTNVGGLIGINNGNPISNSYSVGTITAPGGTDIGGWMGYNDSTSHSFTNNAWYTGSATEAIGLDNVTPAPTLSATGLRLRLRHLIHQRALRFLAQRLHDRHSWDFTTPVWIQNHGIISIPRMADNSNDYCYCHFRRGKLYVRNTK